MVVVHRIISMEIWIVVWIIVWLMSHLIDLVDVYVIAMAVVVYGATAAIARTTQLTGLRRRSTQIQFISNIQIVGIRTLRNIGQTRRWCYKSNGNQNVNRKISSMNKQWKNLLRRIFSFMTQTGWLGSDFTICTEFLICRLNNVCICVGRCITTRSVNLLTISSTFRFALIFINGPNIHHCDNFNWTILDLCRSTNEKFY